MVFVNLKTPNRRLAAGFTFVEALVALSVLGIGVATTIGAMTQINNVASISRNLTGAQTAAQNQVDLLLSDSPFNPQKTNLDGTAQIPPELTLGTHTINNVAIYKEPTTGIIVFGTMTTTVTDVTGSYNGSTIPMYACAINLTYTYRGKTYSTKANTVRVSDI